MGAKMAAPPRAAVLALLMALLGLFSAASAENGALTPPYFNIALNRNVSVNATCGEGIAGREVYCKLVGYDRPEMHQLIRDGQVK